MNKMPTQNNQISLDEILIAGGVTLLNSGKFADAAIQFEKVLTIRPNDASTLTNLGLAYEGEGNARMANNAYWKAIKLDPKFSGRAYAGYQRTLPGCLPQPSF